VTLQESSDHDQRVARERVSHSASDVLGVSRNLKRIFCHTERTPARARLERDILQSLGRVEGNRVLDLGCGLGENTLDLARRGALAVGIDLSLQYLCQARADRDKQTDRATFGVMDAHQLAFRDQAFDCILGRGVLHHLNAETGLQEVQRVLRPGGRAVFVEPLAANPLLRLLRILTPRARTADERPLGRVDLLRMERSWNLQCSYYGLITAPVAAATSIFLRPFPNTSLVVWADRLERSLNRIALLRPLNQYVLLSLTRH